MTVGKQFLKYEDHLLKIVNCQLRIKFLQNCKRADIIPNFLRFWVPTNGCFDERPIHEFQWKLLHKDFTRATQDLDNLNIELNEKRSTEERRSTPMLTIS